MIRVTFDDIEVSNPLNWLDLKSVIQRDKTLPLLLTYNEGDLQFTGTAYDYIIAKMQSGFCSEIDCKIAALDKDNNYVVINRGTLFLTDVKINERTCIATVKVDDQSFFARVNNNKSIKTGILSDRSKNGEVIDVPDTYLVDFYSVTANTLVKNDVPCYRVHEVFRYFVDFMTDSRLSFTSDTFDAGGDWEGLCITLGANIRLVDDNIFTQFSFVELLTEINNRIPLIVLIEDSFGSPTLRIESYDYLTTATENYVADNVYEIQTSFDQDKLYSVIKMGSPTDDTVGMNFPENIDVFGFKDEELHTLGTCNLDKTLDLSCQWITSSNAIERILISSTDDYDSEIFLIDTEYASSTNGRTTNSNFLQVTPARYFFNERLTNQQALTRLVGGIPTSVASYFLPQGSGTFKAYLPSNITHTATVAPDNDDYNPIALSAESYDVGGNYNTGTYRFTAPAYGLYIFNSNIHLETGGSGVGTAFAYFQAYLRIFDSSGTLKNVGESFNGVIYGVRMFTPTTYLAPYGIPYIAVGTSASVDFTAVANVVMNTGDYAILRFSKVGTTGDVDYTISSGSSNTFLECDSNSIGGGIYQTVDSDDFPIQLHEFAYPMTETDFNSIVNSPRGYIKFAMTDQSYRKGWIDELKYDRIRGVSTMRLITNKNSQNAN